MSELPFLIDSSFVTGACAGAVVFAALILAPLFRNIALTVAASAVIVTYARGGTVQFLSYAEPLQSRVMEQPSFAAGTLAGALLVGVVFTHLRTLR